MSTRSYKQKKRKSKSAEHQWCRDLGVKNGFSAAELLICGIDLLMSGL